MHGNLEQEIYMDFPPRFENLSNNKVCRLKKPLNGLKQSPKAWFERFTKFLKTYDFIQSQGDHTLFVKHSSLKKIIILSVNVDDIIVTGDDVKKLKL